ncbi:MAG: leucyl/phenylalanyl-tRNA--protein transferase [Bdellovibrionales bacterium]|nr:leucyl/phenylalanyl-tRNA--protein transferase [Bdellovibrionales bacterium]
MPFESPSRFPIDALLAGKVGDVVATSDDVWADLLIDSYEHGIFPWPMSDDDLIPWCSPKKRAILVFSEMTIPRSLAKARRNSELTFTRDRAFADVMRACAEAPRPGQDGTWITPAMLKAYTDLHARGRAHSVEAWRSVGGETKLVGGIYGVDAGGAFAAESMFYREPNASKLALLRLVDDLKEKGSEWLDIQQLTPHLEKLGAREIKRSDFLRRLSQAQAACPRGKLFSP